MTARASKKTMQNIIMATVEFSLDNTKQKFANLSGNQLAINFKCLFVLKITLVGGHIPSARLGVSLSVPSFSVAFSQLQLKSCSVNEATKQQCSCGIVHVLLCCYPASSAKIEGPLLAGYYMYAVEGGSNF